MNDHSHCEICGRMVAVGKSLCGSKDCAEKKEEAQRMKKRSVYLLVALIAAALILAQLMRV